MASSKEPIYKVVWVAPEPGDKLPAFQIFKDPNHPDNPQSMALAREIDHINGSLPRLATILPSSVSSADVEELFEIAYYGLAADPKNASEAIKQLQNYKERISWTLARPYKLDYFRKLLISSAIPCLTCIAVMAVGFYCKNFPQRTLPSFSPSLITLGGIGWVCLGSIIGTILSYMSRYDQLEFDAMISSYSKTLEPWQRIVTVGLLSLGVCVLVNTGAITLSIGTMTTKNLLSQSQLSLSFGILCGFTERLLFVKLEQQSRAAFQSRSDIKSLEGNSRRNRGGINAQNTTVVN